MHNADVAVWTYGSLCRVCGRVTQPGTTDGDPALHTGCAHRPTVLDLAAAQAAVNAAARTVAEERPW